MMEYLVRRRPLTQARPLQNTQIRLLTRWGRRPPPWSRPRPPPWVSVLLARIGVHLQQLRQVKLRLLEHLDLADEDVLQGVDATARLLDLLADGLMDELVDELLERARLRLPGHDVGHLLTDGLDLRVVGVAGLLELVHPLLGEADAEEPQDIAVGRPHVDVRLDQRLPLAHHRPQLVGGELHTVELRQAVVAPM